MKYFDSEKCRKLFMEESCQLGDPVEELNVGKNGQMLRTYQGT